MNIGCFTYTDKISLVELLSGAIEGLLDNILNHLLLWGNSDTTYAILTLDHRVGVLGILEVGLRCIVNLVCSDHC